MLLLLVFLVILLFRFFELTVEALVDVESLDGALLLLLLLLTIGFVDGVDVAAGNAAHGLITAKRAWSERGKKIIMENKRNKLRILHKLKMRRNGKNTHNIQNMI